MKNAFSGFPKEGMQFLRELKENNNRDWFNARKSTFETTVREPMLELIGAVNKEMAKFAPDYVGDASKNIYRIYRDTRFSKDKTPYKTHVAALFWRNGFGKDDGAGFFFLISPAEIEVGGGIYTAMPDTLLAVRQHVADNHQEFKKLYSNAKVKKLFGEMQGEFVSRAPKGFPPDHAAIDLIRRKQFLLMKSIDPVAAVTPKLFGEIVSRFEAMAPFIQFLNVPLAGLRRTTAKKFFEQ